MRLLIAYASLSGNTRDLARQVRGHCEAHGHAVTWLEAGLHTLADAGDPRHDLYLLGSWTDNGGRTPAEMKQFIADLVATVEANPHIGGDFWYADQDDPKNGLYYGLRRANGSYRPAFYALKDAIAECGCQGG